MYGVIVSSMLLLLLQARASSVLVDLCETRGEERTVENCVRLYVYVLCGVCVCGGGGWQVGSDDRQVMLLTAV